MKTTVLVSIALAGIGGLAIAQMGGGSGGGRGGVAARAAMGVDPSAETYENLAEAIIALRKTEIGLIKGVLMHAEASAQMALTRATKAPEAEKRQVLEVAAMQITNIANEGDKAIQAVRQRLTKAGHMHHSDAETQEDYIFIDGKEKKELLGLAQRVGKMGADAPAADIDKVKEELTAAFAKAIKSE